jgi:hypothetical protein
MVKFYHEEGKSTTLRETLFIEGTLKESIEAFTKAEGEMKQEALQRAPVEAKRETLSHDSAVKVCSPPTFKIKKCNTLGFGYALDTFF